MEFRVFHHDHCFDGACSASVFARFHRECIGSASSYSYHGLMHTAGVQFDADAFLPEYQGGNAIVDFKYYASPRVQWWFDHHQSAFRTAADRADFEATQTQTRTGADGRPAGGKFFAADYISCTGLILDVAANRFGFHTKGLEELRYWADFIDGAQYESAQSAVEMAAPAMKLTLALESSGPGFVPRVIPLLTEMSLAEVLAQPFVQQELGPLLLRHQAGIVLLRERVQLDHGVITFDLTDTLADGYSKFIPYYLHPEATYSVGLSRSAVRTKLSVGTSPWTNVPADRLADIAAICQRYGGGGHARVGAISFASDRVEEARQTAAVIAAGLKELVPV